MKEQVTYKKQYSVCLYIPFKSGFFPSRKMFTSSLGQNFSTETFAAARNKPQARVFWRARSVDCG